MVASPSGYLSSVQIASGASQSVVAGSLTVMVSSPSGTTVIRHRRFFSDVSRFALVTSPLATSNVFGRLFFASRRQLPRRFPPRPCRRSARLRGRYTGCFRYQRLSRITVRDKRIEPQGKIT